MGENMQQIEYDSSKDTLEHIAKVTAYLNTAAYELIKRGLVHDQSKLNFPEKELFDKYTPLLKTLTYDSQEYKDSLALLKPALDNHYSVNDHHPEFHPNGVSDMNIYQLTEMLFDWKAASERTKDGDIIKSIDINAKRFGLSEQLVQIFKNTFK